MISDHACRELFAHLAELARARRAWPSFRAVAPHCVDVLEPELGRLEVLRWIERRWPGLEVHELAGALETFDRLLELELERMVDRRTAWALKKYELEWAEQMRTKPLQDGYDIGERFDDEARG